MNEGALSLAKVMAAYPAHGDAMLDGELSRALSELNAKVVVLDDDPTGVQTVHGVSVYTDWSEASIKDGFHSPEPVFFVLTNSRGFSRAKTIAVHEAIGETVGHVAARLGRRYVIISRGDSTLRGHYPIETEALARGLTRIGQPVDVEVIIPFFPEGGRYTVNDVHYVSTGDELTPVGETEFARDRSFGYVSSNLREWVEEKTSRACPASSVGSISLSALRARDVDGIADKLLGLRGFSKLVLNAVTYDDVKVFAIAACRSMAAGARLLFRSAAALPKVLGGIPDRPLLNGEELVDQDNPCGGLIVIGSHVKRTTEQLAYLCRLPGNALVEFDQHTALDDAAFEREQVRALELVTLHLQEGRTTALYTRRERLDGSGGADAELMLAVRISDALSGIVSRLPVRPRFLIAKGGITSSDVGTKGLGVKKALVLGQILPGVPVWKTGAESRFPDMSYVIFPGNVGGEDALLLAVRKMTGGNEDAI